MAKQTRDDQRHKVDSGLAVLRAVRDEQGLALPMTLQDIADCVGCSKETIRKIEKRALMKLRHPSREKVLKELTAS